MTISLHSSKTQGLRQVRIPCFFQGYVSFYPYLFLYRLLRTTKLSDAYTDINHDCFAIFRPPMLPVMITVMV